MRAAVVERYGPPEVIEVVEVPAPVAGKGQVLVRVHVAAVTSADARIRSATFPRGFGLPGRLAFGVRRPRRPVLGSAYAGVVEAVGPGVATFAAGDRVAGMAGLRLGAHAELLPVAADKVAALPAGVSDSDAAGALFGGTTALYFLRDRGAIAPGMSVLVNGAAGAIGTNAVQLARHFGAEVTAVCSAANASLATDLGATRVIDYTTADLGSIPDRFDLVLDAVGNLTIASGRRLLADGGKLLLAVADLADTVRARGDVAAGSSKERVSDIDLLLALLAEGTLRTVVDGSFPLEAIVDAHRRVDTGHKVGNVLVTMPAG
jgi:NADPH:quinone reductase-like Zn-dependent oxidoreductase